MFKTKDVIRFRHLVIDVSRLFGPWSLVLGHSAQRCLVLGAWFLVICLAGCQKKADESPLVQKTTVVVEEKPSEKSELFAGWPKPAVALLITGQQLGYIEPCGCTGLENQKGGLARRHTFIKQLVEDRGWPVVPLDVGSQVKRFGKQQEVKFAFTVQGLRA